MRHGMMIELDKCIGCQACVTSCKERWDTGPGAARDWVMEFEHGKRGKDLGITFYPGLCNHCTGHPCTDPCPTGATYVGAGGVVMVDADVCIGCGNCIGACPYGARHADARLGIVEKCNFCAPYVARGEQPACVSTCLAECRHFGDLDDPNGDLVKLIRAREAAPLTTAKLQIGPKVYYAPPQARAHVLDNNVIKETHTTALTTVWQRYTRPAARYGVPALALATGAGGLLANLVARKARVARKEQEHTHQAEAGAPDSAASGAPAPDAPTLPRHRLGMRLLHWFNVLSWLALLATGTALMIAPSFAIFGEGFARGLSDLVGGQAPLLKLHVGWGLVWALLIVPSFIVLKRGGTEALREIRLRMDDVRWLMRKPFVMAGLSDKPLPPQDKYNAGQKAFAASALIGTTMVIATGLVMTFHLGPPEVIRAAILGHKLAILLALIGLSLHITMAALITDERPALRSMVTGAVDAHHAEAHSSKWVEELKAEQSETGADDEQ